MRDGYKAPLRSTCPPVTFPAWSTFMTGLEPGRHGIFDFIHRDPANYHPVSSAMPAVDDLVDATILILALVLVTIPTPAPPPIRARAAIVVHDALGFFVKHDRLSLPPLAPTHLMA